MPFITLTSGLTIKVPTLGTRNWGTTIFTDTWTKISQHAHTGSPDGNQITASGIAAGTITTTQIANDTILNEDINSAAAIAYSKLALTDSIVNADVNSAAAIDYSKLALTDSIVNADVNSAAAIAYSKLALTDSIVNADVNTAAAIVYSKLALTDSIVNADINSAAAIAYSKLAIADSDLTIAKTSGLQAALDSKLGDSLADGKVWIGNVSNLPIEITLSGDVTVSNAGVTTIGAATVTNTMLAGSIDDSKLNTITTTNKVSGSAIQLQVNKGITDSTGLGLLLDGATLSVGASGLKVNLITNTEVDNAAGIAYSKLALTDSIVNADVNSAAAIVYSKLALTNSIITGDIVDNNITSGKIALNLALGNASTLTPAGTTETLNFDLGNNQIIDLGSASGDVTLTLSNPQTGAKYIILVIQGVTPRDLIWPAACLWPQGQKPIINTASETHKIELFYNGTNYFGDWNVNYS